MSLQSSNASLGARLAESGAFAISKSRCVALSFKTRSSQPPTSSPALLIATSSPNICPENWRGRCGKNVRSPLPCAISIISSASTILWPSTGDHVLREFGIRLQQNLRRAKIGCAPGGEEFAIVLCEIAAPQASISLRVFVAAFAPAFDAPNGKMK